MKKFTKWLAVCAACLALGAVPAAGATTSVQPTVAQASVKTTKPAPKPRRGWYGTMPKKCYYGKDGQTLKGLHKIKGEYYYFGQIKGYMKTGWKNIVRNGKMRRHYFSPKTGKACIGLHKIDGKYYFFNKYGIMKIVNTVDGKTTYYIGSDGVIQARKKGNTMYYANGKKKMNQTSWPALYANDYFLTGSQGGDCFSDSCTFAYLARALGYKNVYVCVDTDLFDDSGHCWAEINGLVYDPLFSEAKNYYKYFGATYASYGLSPIRRVRVN